MFNVVWTVLIWIAVCAAVINGRVEAVANGILLNAAKAIEITIGLIGVMAFWLGIAKVAERAGLTELMIKRIKPIMIKLFPDVPEDHPAMGLMAYSVVSCVLGLNNAAIPFGIRAMQALNKLNNQPTVATNAMCLLMVINASSVQLIPATGLAALAKAGGKNPSVIVITTLLATVASTVCAVVFCLWRQSKSYHDGYLKKTKELN